MTICYCGNHLPYEECCKRYITGLVKTPTAEALMRSRYSAYATGDAQYLLNTTHVSSRKNHKIEDILSWSTHNKWTKLEISDSTETTVTFKAHYLDNHHQEHIHEEKSNFVLENGNWFYVDGAY